VAGCHRIGRALPARTGLALPPSSLPGAWSVPGTRSVSGLLAHAQARVRTPPPPGARGLPESRRQSLPVKFSSSQHLCSGIHAAGSSLWSADRKHLSLSAARGTFFPQQQESAEPGQQAEPRSCSREAADRNVRAPPNTYENRLVSQGVTGKKPGDFESTIVGLPEKIGPGLYWGPRPKIVNGLKRTHNCSPQSFSGVQEPVIIRSNSRQTIMRRY